MLSFSWMSIGICCFTLLVSVSPAVAETYYVTKAGRDENSCLSRQEACLTVGRASRLATKPGDVVRVGPGIYDERIPVTQGGDDRSPVTYTGLLEGSCPTYPTRDPNSPAPRPAPVVTLQGFSLTGSNVNIDCFRIVASSVAGEMGSGVYIAPSVRGITVTNNVVDGSDTPGRPWAGVAMKGGFPLDRMPSDIRVANNFILNTGFGFSIYCKRNCLFERNEVFELKAFQGQTDSDHTRIFGEYVTIRSNYFHGNDVADCGNCHVDCFQTWNVGRVDNVARFIHIDSNVCFNAHQALLARDTSSSTAGEFKSHYGWRVVNNVMGYGPGRDASTWCGLFDHIGDVTFEHNLCISTGLVGYLNGSTGQHRFNIHVNTGWKPYSAQITEWGAGMVESEGNLLYRSDGTYRSVDWPRDLINQQPLFLDPANRNFKIHPQSPARNAAPGSVEKSDLEGKERPVEGVADIGPYEHQISLSTGSQQRPKERH